MAAEDRVYFLAKDPEWAWIGWRLSGAAAAAVPDQARLTLRVWDLNAGYPSPPFFDVEVVGVTDHRYLHLDPSGHSHLVQLGFTEADGTFRMVAQSSPVTMPPAGPAAVTGERWSAPAGRPEASTGRVKGYLVIVLNAHLPYLRHPEEDYPAEENWLYENLIESYIPLLRMISKLADGGVRSGLTVSLSPTLLEMLADPLLHARAVRYAEDHLRLAEQAVRTSGESSARTRLASSYRDCFHQSSALLAETGVGGLISLFRRLAESGHLEIVGSCASHAYLPLWATNRAAVELQVRVGAAHYRQTFGKPAQGFWLPECGFSPGVDEVLAAVGVDHFFVAAHGILNGTPPPRYGVHAPVVCASGVTALGKDWHSHDLVWRKEVGYPGDPAYLDWWGDADTPTGFRYWRQCGDRELYDPGLALQRAEVHAAHFVDSCRKRIEELRASLGTRPVLVALFDAEHFGHWWHEGPQWLELVIRKLASETDGIRLIGAAEYLALQTRNQLVEPAMSSWGYQGYNETWLMGRNHWIYPLLSDAFETLEEMSTDGGQTEMSHRLLDQYIRELLCAQSSDWAFILHRQTVEAYATTRVVEHVGNMRKLAESLRAEHVDEGWLSSVERRNRLFASLDLWDEYRRIRQPWLGACCAVARSPREVHGSRIRGRWQVDGGC